MENKTVIDRETLLPISLVIAILSSVVALAIFASAGVTKLDVQAAEMTSFQKDYIYHKQKSENYFMSISKSLSRIEGKLEEK